jgi:hypothetical protein
MYSPVARFRVQSHVEGNAVTVVIDSGALSVPGEKMAIPLPIMNSLYVTAFLAAPDSLSRPVTDSAHTSSGRVTDQRAWHALATSDSMLIAAELSYGEQLPIAPLRFSLPRPSASAVRADQPLWIVFRITGNTVDLLPASTPGGPPEVRPRRGGVQVYACGERDVLGRFDEVRSAMLRRAYGLAC